MNPRFDEEELEEAGELLQDIFDQVAERGFAYDDGSERNGEIIPGYTPTAFTLTSPSGKECTFHCSLDGYRQALAWIREQQAS